MGEEVCVCGGGGRHHGWFVLFTHAHVLETQYFDQCRCYRIEWFEIFM